MTLTIDFGSDSRGVSDVVGYVLIFSLITATVGVVTVVGFGTLEDRQAAERVNNVERAFDVFGNNMENVYRDGAPSRATEMRLAGGTLQYGEPVTVTIQNASDTSINHTMELTPLVYTDGETEIVYAGGAIIRGERGSAVMLQDPPFRIGSQRTLLPLVHTTGFPDLTAISIDGTVRVRATIIERVSEPVPELSDADEIRINVSSPRDEAWERYFDRKQTEFGGDVSNDEEVSYTFNTQNVFTPQYRVQLRLER